MIDHVTSGAPDRTAPAVSAAGLSKRFGDRIAFQDVSFEVGRGEVFGFLGPNGAGKTTTVRTLATLLAPTSGSASVAGLPLTPGNGERIRRRIAVMPESPGLYLRLSVTENLACFAGLYGLADPRARISGALAAVGLTGRAHDLCASLSKGLRQRVALARALLPDPQVLFLDEPTSGLDPEAAHDVHELIRDLRGRGVTVFVTTHRLHEAEQLCDRVAVLHRTLRIVGSPRELRDRLFGAGLQVRTAAALPDPGRVLGTVPGVRRWAVDPDGGYLLTVTDPTSTAPAVARALVAAGADVLALTAVRHSLEETYLALVGRAAGERR